MSDILSTPSFLKQHQKAILVCGAVVLMVFVLIWLSRNGSQNRGIEAFDHVITKKEN
jgi:hypothetical protein